MKRLLLMCLMAGVVLMTGCERIDVGNVGIKVNMAGTDKGVEDTVQVTGWCFYNPFLSKVIEYPTFVQTAIWTRDINEGSKNNEEISFNSKEGLVVTADISFSYQLQPINVAQFYSKFRADDLERFTHTYLRNVVRDAFNEISATYPIEDIYGSKKGELLLSVQAEVNKKINTVGINVEQLGFVGSPRLPLNVVDAINAKIKATQVAMMIENELRQSEAEAKKKIATAEGLAKSTIAIAEGNAKANISLSRSITPELLKWKQLENDAAQIGRWDGKVPQVSGVSGAFLQIPAFK